MHYTGVILSIRLRWDQPMTIIQISILAIGFGLGQFCYDLRRWLKTKLYVQAMEANSSLQAAWHLLAIVAILSGVSLMVAGFIYWIWWKAIATWVVASIPFGLVAKSLRRIKEDKQLILEKTAHFGVILCASLTWYLTLR